MEIIEATGHVLEAGKSPELTALLASVADATALDGEPRYLPKTCRDLARAIVCRKYSGGVLQLCHMVNAVDACGAGNDRWEQFFFGLDKIRGTAIRAWLGQAVNDNNWRRPGFDLARDGIQIEYSDGEFALGFGRMPFLAALLETVIGMVGYEPVDRIFQEMTAQAEQQEGIKDAANALNRLIYGWLKNNLPSSHSAEKFEAILAWLKSGNPEASAIIDDAGILAFWRQQNIGQADAESDFRTFRSAVGGFVDFLRAVETGASQTMVSYARPLGTDYEAGEIDPLIAEDGEMPGQWETPLAQLDTPPADAIKFLNKREREELDFLMDCGPLAIDLPLSILRSEVFGSAQAKITQALRHKAPKKDVAALLLCDDAEPYGERSERFYDHENHLLRVQKALLYALTADETEALDSDDNQTEVDDSNVVQLFAGQSIPADTLDESRQAFRELNRKGFSRHDLEDPDIREGYSVGAGALVQARDHLADFLVVLARLQSEDQDLEDTFDIDHQVFRDLFATIYGANK
jgi:hypothetical protein